MAAFNFPASPSNGDTYTLNSVTYQWDGTKWVRYSAAVGAQGSTGSTGPTGAQGAQGHQGLQGAQAHISTSAPSSGVNNGDLWWESDTGDLAIYYNDGNSSQWIDINTGPRGAQGGTGPTGAQGATAAQGAQGAQGHQGATGSTGAQGATGSTGSQGAANATTIVNYADNKLVTATGNATTLNAEGNLTYDGTTLQVQSSGSGLRELLRLKNSNASAGVSGLFFNSTTSGTAFDAACVRNGVNGSGQGRLFLQTNNGSGLVTNLEVEYDGQVTIANNSLNIGDSIVHYGDTNTKIRFPSPDTFTVETGGDERLRIASDGKLLLGTTDSGFSGSYTTMTIGNTSTQNTGLTIASSPSNGYSRLHFADANSGAAVYAGFIAYSHADDALLIGTNNSGSDKFRIDSTGRITQNGTTSADTASALTLKNGESGNDHTILELISDPNQTSRIYFGASDDRYKGQIYYKDNDHYMQFRTNGTDRMRINNDGTVYFSENIATQSPSGQFGFRMDRGGGNSTSLHVENYANDSVNNNAEVKLVTNHSNVRIVHHNQGGFYIIQSASGYLHYYQNGVSRVYIDANGRVGVNYTGTAGWAEQLNVRGTYGTGQYAIAAQITNSSGSLMRFGTSSGVCGSISGSGTSTSFNTSSDYRLKENDVNITDGIARVKQLRPIRFNWKSDSSKTEDGFFAHEVSPVVPESVTGEKDAEIDEIGEGYQRMDHSKLVPLLTAALKEAISEIETLKTKVTALEGS